MKNNKIAYLAISFMLTFIYFTCVLADSVEDEVKPPLGNEESIIKATLVFKKNSCCRLYRCKNFSL